jgi:hypothetical protein
VLGASGTVGDSDATDKGAPAGEGKPPAGDASALVHQVALGLTHAVGDFLGAVQQGLTEAQQVEGNVVGGITAAVGAVTDVAAGAAAVGRVGVQVAARATLGALQGVEAGVGGGYSQPWQLPYLPSVPPPTDILSKWVEDRWGLAPDSPWRARIDGVAGLARAAQGFGFQLMGVYNGGAAIYNEGVRDLTLLSEGQFEAAGRSGGGFALGLGSELLRIQPFSPSAGMLYQWTLQDWVEAQAKQLDPAAAERGKMAATTVNEVIQVVITLLTLGDLGEGLPAEGAPGRPVGKLAPGGKPALDGVPAEGPVGPAVEPGAQRPVGPEAPGAAPKVAEDAAPRPQAPPAPDPGPGGAGPGEAEGAGRPPFGDQAGPPVGEGRQPQAPEKPQAADPGDLANCFPAGTLVATLAGLRSIEKVETGEEVWSYDLVASAWRLCRVLRTFCTSYQGTSVFVTLGGETIESTALHPYWVVRGEGLAVRPCRKDLPAVPGGATTPGRWLDAADLRVGDELLLLDGRVAAVEAWRRSPFEEVVYNCQVGELHCYAVGQNSVLVHNTSAPENPENPGTPKPPPSEAPIEGGDVAPNPGPEGQVHHPISIPIAQALKDHPTLSELAWRRKEFTTQAIDEGAHRGYDKFHRDLDAEVIRWIRDPKNKAATPEQFLEWLRERYSQEDLKARFPEGF